MAAKSTDQSRRVKRAKREFGNDITKAVISGVATVACITGIFVSAAGGLGEEKASVGERSFWVLIFGAASVGGGLGTLWTVRNVSYSAHKYDCIKESVRQEYDAEAHCHQPQTPERHL
ncbi:MAG TPA: hypothetical protein PKI93_07940 [Alphaproteobacteria bacterium]|nr:hypothetical protein [Alphaproteobacteria bacterium]HNS44948.1 hypothetical protein [Alphaproteobacteria bacterium]